MKNPLGQHLRELPGPLLLTGHTGFKGTWMTFLLEYLNVPVIGYSLPADKDSLYDRTQRNGVIPEVFADIRDYEPLENFIDQHKPSTIVHMAAQPLVLQSYETPRETFDVNVMGTSNLLDIAFKKDFVKAVIVVTTDKVYRNENTGRAFVESDPLEGKDPYSASKVGAEAVVAAWQQISKISGGPKVASVRAGNVIGGGDFAQDRIIPDLIRGAIAKAPIEIRNPGSTRPWQHVLDPLRGYLMLVEKMEELPSVGALNFSPSTSNLSVNDLILIGMEFFDFKLTVAPEENIANFEHKFLNLDSTLAASMIEWSPMLTQEEAIKHTFSWWKKGLELGIEPTSLIHQDIQFFFDRIEEIEGLVNDKKVWKK